MKKLISVIMSIFVCTSVFASEASAQAYVNSVEEFVDSTLTQEQIDEVLANTIIHTSEGNSRASDLIAVWALGISKSGTDTLNYVARTVGTYEVVKSGFKELVVQRRRTSSDSWSDYITYEDLYVDLGSYTIAKSITVPTGYQYRMTCIHYAKKNLFSTQKIDNESNIVSF